MNFKKLQSLLNTWGSHLLRPLEALTFWIASQVGKISNEAHLHLADSVHTPFVWREWFPPGLLAGPLCCSETPGTRKHPAANLRFTRPCHSKLADHPRHSLSGFISPLSSNLHPLPCYSLRLFFPSGLPLMVPHTISFKAHLTTANLENMSEYVESWIEQLGIHLRDSKQLYIASHFSHCQMNVIIFYFCHYQSVAVHFQ